ncbi:MAG: tetratricopeptide repeat protein [Candidatus Wallbacteria bacterium]|nr:tetratricopeptide repeat protein [Candidatus Wallbacteria bacterium]
MSQARRLLAKYRLREAMATLAPHLEAHSDDSEALLIAGQVFEAMGDLQTAQTHYRSAVAAAPGSAEARARLARSLLALRDLDEAATHLRGALADAPPSALTLATAALYHLQRGRYDLSQQYADRAVAADPGSKEAALCTADLRCNRGDLAGARRVLERLLLDNPADADGLYMMGVVLFNQRDFLQAQTYLERSSGLNAFAAGVLRDLAHVYIQNGQLEQGLTALDRVLERVPGDASALSMRSCLVERIELVRRGVQTQIGAFHFVHSPELGRQVLDGIAALFQEAYTIVCPQLGGFPTRVDVWIFDQTSGQLPAYYNHLNDEIVVSRKYFSNLGNPAQRRIGRHLVLHEFTHLVAYQKLGKPAFTTRSLWLMEGLAERMAGGYEYADVEVPWLFRDGLLDFSALAEQLPVSAVGSSQARAKAYVQAFLMVDWLFRRPDPLSLFAKMIADYSAGKSDLEITEGQLNLTPDAVLGQVAGHIRTLSN